MASVDLYNMRAFLDLTVDSAKAGLTAGIKPITRQIGRTLNLASGPAPSAPGEPPHNQTGDLIKRWRSEAARDDLTARATTDNPVATWMERGAHIRPKNGKLIAIPLTGEARRMLAAAGGRARSVINALSFDKSRPLVRIKTKNGILYARQLSKRRGKDQHGPIEPFILMTDHADIAPRPYIQRSIRDSKESAQRAFNGAFRSRFNAIAPGGVR